MASIDLLGVFLALVCLYIFSCLYAFVDHRRKRVDPIVPIYFPIIGMIPSLIHNFHRFHDWGVDLMDVTKGTFLFKGLVFSNMHLLTTVDPANIHYIMSSNFSNFPKGDEFKKIFDVFGDGIFNVDHDLWRNQRKMAQSLINHRRFHKFVLKTTREKVENGLVPILNHIAERGVVLDLQDLFQRFTFDSTLILSTGYNPGCVSIEFPDVPFAKAMRDVTQTIFHRHMKPETLWRLERWLNIGEEKALTKAEEVLNRITSQYISQKRREESTKVDNKNENENENEDNNTDGIDLLTSYLQQHKIECQDDKFLRDTILNFMLAGIDTTSSALTWFFWLMATHPKILNKVREELKSKVRGVTEKLRMFNFEEVNNLVYLHATFLETLRLYPSVPFQHKAPFKSDVLPSGHRVEHGAKICISFQAMGRMKSIWGDDCSEFKPERWIDENGGIKLEPSSKFLPFNAGPRTCLGKDVAFTQMKTVAASLLHNFDFEVVKGHRVVPNLSIILQMKYGLMVKVYNKWI